MLLIFFAATLLASTAALLMLKRDRYTTTTHLMINQASDKPSNIETKALKSGKIFRGFTIEPCADCCQASLELRKMTFSYRDKITLPLSSCDKTNCCCEIVEVGERRKQHRRSKMDRRSQIRFEPHNDDRRKRKGRREQDQLWSGGYIY